MRSANNSRLFNNFTSINRENTSKIKCLPILIQLHSVNLQIELNWTKPGWFSLHINENRKHSPFFIEFTAKDNLRQFSST